MSVSIITKATQANGTAASANVSLPLTPGGFLPNNAGIVVVIGLGAGSVSNVTDSVGNSYTRRASYVGGAKSITSNQEIWVCNASKGTRNTGTITVTISASTSFAISAFGIFGQNTSNAVDGASNGNSGLSNTPNDVITTTQQGDLVLAAIFLGSGTTSISFGNSGFSQLGASQFIGNNLQENFILDPAPSGIVPVSATTSQSVPWAVLCIAFGPAPGPSGIVTVTTPNTTNNPTTPGSPPNPYTTLLVGTSGLLSPGGNPSTPNTTNRDTTITGPSNRRTCVTAGVTNGRLVVAKTAAGIPPENLSYAIGPTEPPEGFFAHLPVNGPDNINVPYPTSGNYGTNYFATDAKGNQRKLSSLSLPSGPLTIPPTPGLPPLVPIAAGAGGSSVPAGNVNSPLFNGIIHFVLVNFNNGNNNQISNADAQTIINFINQVAAIQAAYGSQWGSCGMVADTKLYSATINIPSGQAKFNDATLGGNPGVTGAVDTIATQLGFASGGPTAHCIVIVAPPSVTNTDCDPSQGYLAYHNATQVNNIAYIYLPLTASGLTSEDISDLYQAPLSHEIAEVIVDPAANYSNPEVCDSCGPNCQTVIRNFFDANSNYLGSSSFFVQGTGPGFSYAFMANAVAQPSYGSTPSNACPNPPYSSCAYPPPGTSNNQSPGFPTPTFPTSPQLLSPLIGTAPTPPVPSGIANILFPNGLVQEFLTQPNAQGISVIQLPLNFS